MSLGVCLSLLNRENPKYPKWSKEVTAWAHTHWEEEAETGLQQTKWRKDSLKTQWFTLEKLFCLFSLSSPSCLFVWLCCAAPGTSRVTIRQLFLQEQASEKQCGKSDKARKYDKYSALQWGVLPFPSVYSWEEIHPSRSLFLIIFYLYFVSTLPENLKPRSLPCLPCEEQMHPISIMFLISETQSPNVFVPVYTHELFSLCLPIQNAKASQMLWFLQVFPPWEDGNM